MAFPRRRIHGGNLVREFDYLYRYTRYLSQRIIQRLLARNVVQYAPEVEDVCHDALLNLLQRNRDRLPGYSLKIFLHHTICSAVIQYNARAFRQQQIEVSEPGAWSLDRLETRIDVQHRLDWLVWTRREQMRKELPIPHPTNFQYFLSMIQFFSVGIDDYTLREMGRYMGVAGERARQIRNSLLRHPETELRLLGGWETPAERRAWLERQQHINQQYRWWNEPAPYPEADPKSTRSVWSW